MSISHQVDQASKWKNRVDNSLQRWEVKEEYRRYYEYGPSVEEDKRICELMLSIFYDVFALI